MLTAKDRYLEYLNDVISGKQLAPKRVIRSCKRTMARFDDPDMYMDWEELERFVTLSESLLINDSHDLAGQHVRILGWQLWLMGNTIGWKWKENDGVVDKIAMCEVARGAGKSALAAILAIYWASTHDGLDVHIVSGKRDQSKIIIDSCGDLLRSTDAHGLEYEANRYECRIGQSTITAISGKSHTMDGLRGRVIIDEFHEIRDENVWTKVSSMLPKGKDYQVLSISTPGSPSLGLESPYYRTRVIAETCLQDWSKLKTVGSYLYGIDEEDLLDDENCWIKAQPSLGHIISMKSYRDAWENAVEQNNEATFERLQACRYSLRSTGWIDGEVIEACSEDLNLEDFYGQTAYLGVDMSKCFDISSVALQVWKDQKCHAFLWHFVPGPGARQEYRAHAPLLSQWGKRDFVQIVETPTIDYDVIRDLLLFLMDKFDIPKDGIGLDQMSGMKSTLQSWTQDYDIPIIGIPQVITVIGPATFQTESLIREGAMTIRRDPVLEYCISCVQMQTGMNGDRRPTKEKSTGQIDAVIALIQATTVAIEAGAHLPPAYRTDEDIIL